MTIYLCKSNILKCDYYDDKYGIFGVSRVQKKIKMRNQQQEEQSRQPEPALLPARSAEMRRRREATQTTSTYPDQGGIYTMVLKPLKMKPMHLEWL